MKTKIIAIFDIGKTNKKLLLFDLELNLLAQSENVINTITDDDGFECDDIDFIEKWILESVNDLLNSEKYDLEAINFSTYGASLLFLDENGKRLTPLYNYLKEIPKLNSINLFNNYEGKNEFCRKTASPDLGLLLNSGVQILWYKEKNPKVFSNVRHILHFPQYLSFLFTKKVCADPTSIGCHTFLWDFDNMQYHKWVTDSGIQLPKPQNSSTVETVVINNKNIKVGIGLHDSSSSLIPYLKENKEPLVLISTGTWVINMNPFNNSPLTTHQLENDCLNFLSYEGKSVKSSRFFMGHIHDVNVELISKHFNTDRNRYKKVVLDEVLLTSIFNKSEKHIFFKNGFKNSYIDNSVDFTQFPSFKEAYHQMMFDLVAHEIESLKLILDETKDVKKIHISGGFARNEIFVKLIRMHFTEHDIITGNTDNSSALGAAMVMENLVITQ